ncbi:MAG: SusC/RagA family TonB-linked outer membrane protein [Daejeonella sp.]
MKTLVLILFVLFTAAFSTEAQSLHQLSGTVLSTPGNKPLPGASIRVKGQASAAFADAEGRFSIQVKSADVVLIVSYIGFKPSELALKLPLTVPLEIRLMPSSSQLEEVVVSTGYQDIPQERVTGSFTRLDSSLLNKRVSMDILSRLENTVAGLTFNRRGRSTLSIRGQSTIFANAEPLVVLDNFPYDGDINNINPNDVESITILKDAAAASIWGARAGNGVIVITTRKGRFNRPMEISFNSNVTAGWKPDLFYQPKMSSADYIATEQKLFSRNFYRGAELSANRTALTPVVELLIARRDGKVSAAEADARLEVFKKQDVRSDLERYFYQPGLNQQYALNLRGGSQNQRYLVSGGYDRNRTTQTGNSNDRYTLNASHTYTMLKQKLELSTGLYYVEAAGQLNNPGTTFSLGTAGITQLYPYARMADEQGNPLAIVKGYRESFITGAPQKGLLNWEYKPLEELALANNSSKLTDYRLNLGLKYRLSNSLNAGVLYQYGRSMDNSQNLQGADAWYTRDMINRFAQINKDGTLMKPVPEGGIMDFSNGSFTSRQVRGQVNYQESWKEKHQLSAISGMEVRDNHSLLTSGRFYGYDDEHATSRSVDYISVFKQYYNPTRTAMIPDNQQQSDRTDRFVSWYANAAYTYDRRYTVSASGRIDQSNLFGVKANQRGVPLYSAGLAWNLNEEAFYAWNWLPYLKLRTTFGYNGNTDRNLSAYTTARYLPGSISPSGLNYARVENAPNPELRWERVRIFNIGLDFAAKNSVLSGSLEYYRKNGLDLIGETPFPPSSGITRFKGNTAMTQGHGIDLTLNASLRSGNFIWQPGLLFAYAQDKIKRYLTTFSAASYLSGINPAEGKPMYSFYSYRWAGLDPQTGDPQGYLNGQPSKDYAKIISTANRDNMTYSGASRPPVFGALRNTLTWKNLSISANVSYRLGYYFRRGSVGYGNTYGLGTHGDYQSRWQKPGDEAFTQVPSIPLATNNNRDNLYRNSETLVEKGDHLRLQDIQLNYVLPSRLKLRNLSFYLYANNLGILWKAASGSLDPDYATSAWAPPATLAAGMKLNL